jgi:hypothetical protein
VYVKIPGTEQIKTCTLKQGNLAVMRARKWTIASIHNKVFGRKNGGSEDSWSLFPSCGSTTGFDDGFGSEWFLVNYEDHKGTSNYHRVFLGRSLG